MEVRADEVWWLTTDQMRDVDRITMQRFGVDLARMMENAGRALAELAIVRFSPSSVIVLAGSGGNGGGGMVAARHLAGRGVEVAVTLSSPYQMSPVPAEQLAILDRLGVPQLHAPRSADLVIDALVGYGLTNSPAGRVAELISWANDQSSPILALDVPSGLDSTTGVAGSP